MHFGTGVLDTSALAGVYVTQVCFYTNVHICKHTRCRLYKYVYIDIYVFYECRSVHTILLTTNSTIMIQSNSSFAGVL